MVQKETDNGLKRKKENGPVGKNEQKGVKGEKVAWIEITKLPIAIGYIGRFNNSNTGSALKTTLDPFQ